MSTFFVIIGFIFIITGITTFAYFFKKKFYNFKESFGVEILKKSWYFIGISIVLFLLGFIFVTLCYYNNPIVLSYFSENNISVSGGDYAAIFLGEIFFVLFLGSFIFCLFSRMYLSRKNKKLDLILRIVQYVSIVASIGFFLLYMEGQADYLIYPLANVITFSSKGINLINTNSSSGKTFLNEIGEGFHFQIAFYAIFIISGAFLVLYICDHKLYKKYGHHNLITTCFFIAFPCGIIGARIWYVIGNWTRDGFNLNPARIFYIWEGGLAIMGGAIFGIIAGIAVMIVYKIVNSRYKVIDYLLLVDIIVPTILVAQAIGRFGNFFNNEVHGQVVDISYWNWLPSFIKNNMHYSSSSGSFYMYGDSTNPFSAPLDETHIFAPLFLIEGMVNLFGYFFIEYGIMNLFGVKQSKKKDYHAGGSLVGWYISWYGLTRVILEPLRSQAYNMGENDDFSLVSAYVMVGGGLFIVLVCIILKILNSKGKFEYQWQKYCRINNINLEENEEKI